MSVVVNMPIPVQCASCPMWGIIPFKGRMLDRCNANGEMIDDPFKKPDWCPIICKLPEGHGRLIDASTIIGEVDAGYTDDYGNPIPVSRQISVDDYLGFEVPTIVPAERSET